MQQLLQYQKNGNISVENLPRPVLKKNHIIVKNIYSAISKGTEINSVNTAKANLIQKAKKRPDLVGQVINNWKREGTLRTYHKVKERLDNYKQLGYSSAGIVVESDVKGINPGDRVACGGNAYHAEYICVPKHLVSKIPDNVDLKSASFTTIASIALQGVRQSKINIGETVAVVGLGLIGLITIQILKANGARVIGIDINDGNFKLAKKYGAEFCIYADNNLENNILSLTKNIGVDISIITASSKSSLPIESAAIYTRKKGRIVIVGDVRISLPRSPFYEKELEITISCSYGNGRYDYEYEEKGNDYPIEYVRWTENRNFETVLYLISKGVLSFNELISEEIEIEEADKVYDKISSPECLSAVIKYSEVIEEEPLLIQIRESVKKESDINLAILGAGNFCKNYIIPNLPKEIHRTILQSNTPVNARKSAEKFQFENCTTDISSVLENESINTVIISTRHSNHGKLVAECLKRNKNVFVEKPLAISKDEIIYIKRSYNAADVNLMVGYNRRFSKPITDLKNYLNNIKSPKIFNYNINAGMIDPAHWTQQPEHGGRIIGEVCHFIDTLIYLTDSLPVKVDCLSLNELDLKKKLTDNVSINILLSDGSLGTIIYHASGNNRYPKERLEVHSSGNTFVMDDFKKLYIFLSNGGTKKIRYDGNKGHNKEIELFFDSIVNRYPLIKFEEIISSAETSIFIKEKLDQQDGI